MSLRHFAARRSVVAPLGLTVGRNSCPAPSVVTGKGCTTAPHRLSMRALGRLDLATLGDRLAGRSAARSRPAPLSRVSSFIDDQDAG